MPVHNAEIAALFNELADLLEIEGDNPFRVRAYRNAARVIEGHAGSLAEAVREGEDLSKLPGIGKEIAGKIAVIVDSGNLPALEEARGRVPAVLSELMRLPGLGPKRVKALHQALHIGSMADLEQAAREGRLRELEGFGRKTEEQVLEGIQRLQAYEKRFRLPEAEAVVRPLVAWLEQTEGLKRIEVAGSYRRHKETVGDLDILVACRRDAPVVERFVDYDEVDEVISQGTTRSSVRLRSGLQVDLRVVPEVSYGAALHYFTGSKAHNIAVRRLAQQRGLKVNEYGVFEGEERVAGRTEEEVYATVDLPWIEPELREDRGEIEAAQKGRLPGLVTLDDIRGDLHCHTRASDGHNTLEELARAAAERGYAYLAVTDHTRHLTVAHGLDPERLAKQIEEIDRLNDKLDGVRLLKSAEVDILADGALDLPDDILARLDLTVCAVHSRFDLSAEKQTERILRAMDNPHFNILAHPSGRLINEREAYDVDLERVLEAARERGCHLEVNGQPQRLDLTDAYCRTAREHGVKVALSTDAHAVDHLEFMRFALGQARRGWLEPDDVLNTRPWSELKTLLARR